MTDEQRLSTIKALVSEVRSATANALRSVDDAASAEDTNTAAGALMSAEIEMRAALKLVEASLTVHRVRARS